MDYVCVFRGLSLVLPSVLAGSNSGFESVFLSLCLGLPLGLSGSVSVPVDSVCVVVLDGLLVFFVFFSFFGWLLFAIF